MGRYARVSWRRMVGEWEGTLELAGGEWWVSGKVELAGGEWWVSRLWEGRVSWRRMVGEWEGTLE